MPTMISSSSLISRMNFRIEKPFRRATSPSPTKTKIAAVAQKVSSSLPSCSSAPPPNCATVNAMPPKAPSGATHMIMRMTPKTILLAVSKPPTTRLRSSGARPEIAAATRIASSRTFSTSLSTNGCTKLVGSRSSVMKPTIPPPASPASAMLSLASPAALCDGLPEKPSPGLTTLAATRPSASATSVATRK